MSSVLLTGGAGYIGSHTYVALVQSGYEPVILDDFSNSSPAVPERLQRITGEPVVCERGNVSDTALVQSLIQRHQIGAVIHFAGFKAVGESVAKPLNYFANNLGGMVSLLQAMEAVGCCTLVRWETPRLCRGGSRSLTFSGVWTSPKARRLAVKARCGGRTRGTLP